MVTYKGAMQSLIEMFDNALKGLNVKPPMSLIEGLAIIVHDAMSVQTRSYHNLEHIFYFDTKDPISHLAALFHDIVYYQVDKGFHPELEPLILPFIQETKGDFFINENIDQQDMLFNIVLDLFNFSPGERLSVSNGLNEFLSAVVMVELLERIVSTIDILRIAICIEATIPFRGRDKMGNSHFEVLKQRLQILTEKYKIDFPNDSIDHTLKLAVLFSNQDVKTFAEKNVARFLDITWKLLPESNVALRFRGSYTIRDYRMALQRMRMFMENLNPENIFNQYLDTPSKIIYRNMRERAKNNLRIAVEYMKVKLVGIGLLEALADYTGGDAPLSLFAGDIPKQDLKIQRINDFLPEIPVPDYINPKKDKIYRLLAFGRFSDESFDLKNSPLSLFVYLSLTPSEIEGLDLICQEYFDAKLDPETFFQQVPRHLLLAVAKSCASMALTRREKLYTLISRLN